MTTTDSQSGRRQEENLKVCTVSLNNKAPIISFSFAKTFKLNENGNKFLKKPFKPFTNDNFAGIF
jgi:hypothetical protein